MDWISRIMWILGSILFFWIARKVYNRFKGKFSKKSKAVKTPGSKKEALARRKRMIIILPLVAIILAFSGFYLYDNYLKYYLQGKEITTTELAEKLKATNYQKEKLPERIVMLGETYSIEWRDGTIERVNLVGYQAGDYLWEAYAYTHLGTEIIIKPPLTFTVMVNLVMILVMIALIVYLIWWWPKVVRGATFVKAFVKGVDEWSKIKFSEVGALKEAKQRLLTVIKFLKNPEKFRALGAKMPKGVLLSGPPGCGKTYLARALAGEAEVPYFNMAGPEFVEMWVGVGASKVRQLFQTARANAPCIVFIDEIDAFAKRRSTATGSGAPQESEETLTQLLTELDGFDPTSGILVVAATNRPDVLDPALLRPGRIDIKIVFSQPDRQGRKEILEVHAAGKPFSKKIDFDKIAQDSPGRSGADMANIINEAALRTAKEKRNEIEQSDLEYALEKIIMGPEKKSRFPTLKENELTAYHEAGHALVAKAMPGLKPPEKISIVPRLEGIGGFTWIMPEERYILTKERAFGFLTMLLGGRAAEIVALDLLSTGATSDLQRATELAKKMVCFYGMSEKIGPQFLSETTEQFSGVQEKDYSEYMAEIIDEEIDRIVSGAFEKAKEILQKNREKLERVKEALIKNETLDKKEFEEIAGEVV